MENLIVVEQLPIIIEKLETIKQQVVNRVQYAKTCACTVDTVKEAKKYRTDLKKEFEQLEEQRKSVKADIMKPYLEFEVKYKECITNIYLSADLDLKTKIDEVEGSLKDEKEKNIQAYFNEYIITQGVEWLDFKRAGIAITLSASEKKLKEEVRIFVGSTVSDLEVIKIQEEDKQPEMFLEYKRSLSLQTAIQTVIDRYVQLERIKAQEEERKVKIQAEQEHVQVVENIAELTAPKVAEQKTEQNQQTEQSVKKFSTTFKVIGTLEELRAVKEFLNQGGYKYEC